MPSSSKILRGLHIQGRRIYYPRLEKKVSPLPAGQEDASLPAPDADEKKMVEQPDQVLDQARKEGEKLRQEILEEATAEARRLEETAREEGFHDGFQQGKKEAEKYLEEARQTLEQACEERREILAAAEPEIIRLALNIAEKILDYEVNMNDRCILAIAARGLNTLPAGQKVYIRVNPFDEKICQDSLQELQGMLKKGVLLEIAADEQLTRGSCRLESEEAEVVILLQKELQILGKKLLSLAVPAGEEYLQEIAGAVPGES